MVGGFKVRKISLKCTTYSETSDKGHSEREQTSSPTKDKLKVLTCIHTLPLKEDKGQNGWSRRCSLLRMLRTPLLGRLIEACFAVERFHKKQMIGYHNRTMDTKS